RDSCTSDLRGAWRRLHRQVDSLQVAYARVQVLFSDDEPGGHPAASCFERHCVSCHETRELADPLATLHGAVQLDCAIALPGRAVAGYGQVVTADLLFGHAGSVVLHDD